MKMTLPKHIPTLIAHAMGNYTHTDNIFMSATLANNVVSCNTVPEDQPAHSDHIPIDTNVQVNISTTQDLPKYNFREVD